MNNVHPAIAGALAPFVPPPQKATLFVVKINGDSINVLAPNSREAINAAMLRYRISEDEPCPQEGFEIAVRPA